MKTSRREMLGALAAAGAVTLVEPGEVLARFAADAPCVAGGAVGELLGTLPLFRDRSQPQEFGVKYGGVGLDARLVTDLSRLEPGTLITANDLAYIRTEIPAAAKAHQGPWLLDCGGLASAPAALKLDDLTARSKKMGPHLFECSGNANPSNFGLMSVAEWEGIPLIDVVSQLQPSKEATGVLVSGFDHVGQNSRSSEFRRGEEFRRVRHAFRRGLQRIIHEAARPLLLFNGPRENGGERKRGKELHGISAAHLRHRRLARTRWRFV